MTVNRRTFLVGSGTLVMGASMATLLAACSDSAPTVRTSPGGLAKAHGPVEYWAAMQGDQRPAFQEFLANFKRAYPKVDIQVSYKNLNTLDQQIQTALAAGSGPDLVPSPGPSNLGGYVDANLLLPLDNYATERKWGSKLLPWALESGKLKGKIWAIPTSFETIFVLYNKTLFDSKGYTKPTNRAQLEALCQEIAGSGIKPFAAGNAEFTGVNVWWLTFAFNHVAGPDATYEALTGKRHWTDSVFYDSVNLVKNYFQRGWVGGGVKQYFTTQFDTIYSEFATGKAAMYMSGSWEFPSLTGPFKKSGQQYDWMPIPALSDQAGYPVYDIGIGGTLSISSHTKNPDAAATFLDWQISDPKDMLEFVAKTDGEPMPVPFKAADLPKGFNPQEASQYAALIDATSHGNFGYTLWTFWSAKGQDYLLRNFSNVITNQMSVADYLSAFDKIHQKDLAANLVPHVLPRMA